MVGGDHGSHHGHREEDLQGHIRPQQACCTTAPDHPGKILELDEIRKSRKSSGLMRDEKEQEAAKLANTKETIYIVATTTFCSVNYHLATCLVKLVEPVQTVHGNIITDTKTRRGCQRYLVDLSCGRWPPFVLDIIRQLSSQEVVKAMGIANFQQRPEDTDPMHLCR